MFLNPTELYELTGKKRRQAQVEALRMMGVEHRVRPDGTVAVMRAHVESVFGGIAPAKVVKSAEPNWSAIRPRMTEWDECPDCNGSGIGVRSVSCLEKCDGACGGLGKVIRQVDGTLSYIARQAELNHPDFNRVAKMNAERARALLAKLPAQKVDVEKVAKAITDEMRAQSKVGSQYVDDDVPVFDKCVDGNFDFLRVANKSIQAIHE